MQNITSEVLDGYVGKHISEICGCSYIDNSDNHCAHFVCHLKEYNFGLTCFGMTQKGSHIASANIRVQEVFSHCRRVGNWSNKPAEITTGFIFVTKSGNVNVAKKTMANVPKKHIGIFIGQDVWQYKNKLRHVIKQTPEEFNKHYEGASYAIFYGEFPL